MSRQAQGPEEGAPHLALLRRHGDVDIEEEGAREVGVQGCLESRLNEGHH